MVNGYISGKGKLALSAWAWISGIVLLEALCEYRHHSLSLSKSISYWLWVWRYNFPYLWAISILSTGLFVLVCFGHWLRDSYKTYPFVQNPLFCSILYEYHMMILAGIYLPRNCAFLICFSDFNSVNRFELVRVLRWSGYLGWLGLVCWDCLRFWTLWSLSRRWADGYLMVNVHSPFAF